MNAHGDLCVSRVPLFANLSVEKQWDVASYARPIRRAAKELVQVPGTSSPRLLVVHTGRIRISHVTASGQEQVLRVVGPGEFFGETAFITGDPVEHLATAASAVEVCSFAHEDLANLLAAYPAIAAEMMATIARRLQSAERTLSTLTSADVEARLANYLLDAPAQRVNGQTVVRLDTTKKTLASLLGTSPETLSRRLASLAGAGVIAVDGSAITILDPRALEERAQPG